MLDVQRVDPLLWIWTTDHPQWTTDDGGWGRAVHSVFTERPVRPCGSRATLRRSSSATPFSAASRSTPDERAALTVSPLDWFEAGAGTWYAQDLPGRLELLAQDVVSTPSTSA